MVAAFINTWMSPHFGLVDAISEASRQQDEVDLIVDLVSAKWSASISCGDLRC